MTATTQYAIRKSDGSFLPKGSGLCYDLNKAKRFVDAGRACEALDNLMDPGASVQVLKVTSEIVDELPYRYAE